MLRVAVFFAAMLLLSGCENKVRPTVYDEGAYVRLVEHGSRIGQLEQKVKGDEEMHQRMLIELEKRIVALETANRDVK